MNPHLLEVIIKDKRREMLAEAERQQLINIYNAANPGRWARLQLALGDFLIRLGEKIKQRYAQPLDLSSDLCRDCTD